MNIINQYSWNPKIVLADNCVLFAQDCIAIPLKAKKFPRVKLQLIMLTVVIRELAGNFNWYQYNSKITIIPDYSLLGSI